MSLYDVKRVQLLSVIRVFPLVFAILGAVIGLFTFFAFPTEMATGLGLGARFVSWFIFVVLYTLLMSIGAIIVTWLYNVVAGKTGSGVVISLEPKE